MLITRTLVAVIKERFRLNWNGTHGASHWSRVRNNGLRLAKINGANTKVIEYFSFLHDSCRETDGVDENHGMRAASFAKELLDKYVHLTTKEFKELEIACIGHSEGLTSDPNITVMTCWDADRLDIGRSGILPSPHYLCTDEAKREEIIRWAYINSQE